MLIITCIFASWQGVQASAVVSVRSDVCINISGPQVKARIQVSNTIESTEVENTALPDENSSKIPKSDIQLDQYIQNEPSLKQRWALEQIQALPPPPINDRNATVLVAILDTGIDRDHEDLNDRVIAEINLTESATTDDIYGHGTHIAGIVTAKNDNDLGILGLAPESRLINIKVADDKGRCQTSALS